MSHVRTSKGLTVEEIKTLRMSIASIGISELEWLADGQGAQILGWACDGVLTEVWPIVAVLKSISGGGSTFVVPPELDPGAALKHMWQVRTPRCRTRDG